MKSCTILMYDKFPVGLVRKDDIQLKYREMFGGQSDTLDEMDSRGRSSRGGGGGPS